MRSIKEVKEKQILRSHHRDGIITKQEKLDFSFPLSEYNTHYLGILAAITLSAEMQIIYYSHILKYFHYYLSENRNKMLCEIIRITSPFVAC